MSTATIPDAENLAGQSPPVVKEVEQIRLSSGNLRAMIGGQDYQFVGGLGCVLSSIERGVREGDLRAIGNVIFKAYRVNGWKWREIWWVPVRGCDYDWINEFKRAVFSL